VRPRDLASKTRRRLAVEQLGQLVVVDRKIKELTKLKALVVASGSGLMDLTATGPVVAARILADVGDVARFGDRNRFASCGSTDRNRTDRGVLRGDRPAPPLKGRGIDG
jgi:transposase